MKLFEKYYQSQYNKLLTYAVSQLKDFEAAEDIVHDVFCTAIERGEQFHGSKNPEGWLMQTLKYKIMNKKRADQKRKKGLEVYALNAPPVPCQIEDYGIWNYCEEILSHEDYMLLYAVVMEEQTFPTIASQIGISLWACQKRMQRLKKNLRKIVKDEFL